MSESDKTRRRLVGMVVSDKMDKTVVVQTSKKMKHPVYKKFVVRREKYKAHDPTNDCGAGDRVEIEETRPLSREKRWRVVKVLERAS